jgi:hypothetical protein
MAERLEPRNLLSGTSAAMPSAGQGSSAPAAIVQQEPGLTIIIYTAPFDGDQHEAIGIAEGDNDTSINGTFSFTYNGSDEAPTNIGTYNVVATFTSADPNYSNGTAQSTFSITPAAPKITVTGGTFPFDFNSHPASATAIGVDGVTPVAGSFSFTYNGSSNPPVNPGSYPVVATFTSSDANYANATGSGTIVIPDPTIPGGVTVTGASATSVDVSWNSVLEPSGGTPTYNVYERIFHPGHGGGRGGIVPSYYTYNLVASGSTATSAIISGLAPAPTGGTAPGHSYVVTSVLNGVESARSGAATGAPLFAPSFGFYLIGGALWSGSPPLNVTVGQTQQLTIQTYGNEAPTYSVASGPSSVSIDPTSGLISISPTAADVGTFTTTFTATNSLGSVTSAPLAIHVLALPTVVVTGGTFAFDGSTHSATAVAYGSDGVTALTGTFSFTYSPASYPTAQSTAPYAESGSYIVNATFTSSDPNYGNAFGTGTLIIAPTTPTIIVNDGSFVFDGNSHAAAATAVGIDGATPIDGTFDYTYNGDPIPPTAPGTYTVVATFTSNSSDYANSTANATIVVGAAANNPMTTITVGATSTYSLTGTGPTGQPQEIQNDSTNSVGLFVTGIDQVGSIDGKGNITVGDGSTLTVNRIVQGSLVIGGSAGAPATVTIAASDAAGNPLPTASAAVATPATTASSSSLATGSLTVGSTPISPRPIQPPATSESNAGTQPRAHSNDASTSPGLPSISAPPAAPTPLPIAIESLAASNDGPSSSAAVSQSADSRQAIASIPPAAVDSVFEDSGVATSLDEELIDLLTLGGDKSTID